MYKVDDIVITPLDTIGIICGLHDCRNAKYCPYKESGCTHDVDVYETTIDPETGEQEETVGVIPHNCSHIFKKPDPDWSWPE